MSTIKVNAIQNTSGVEVYTCKAWVNFNGTGTVAIRAAGNVSSITDNGVGDFTVNFTSAFVDANYAVVFGSADVDSSASFALPGMTVRTATALSTSSVRARAIGYNGGNYDVTYAALAIFR